jgi:hypothetical protein
MKFKLKVLMAAMALAVAGQASATIDSPAAANGELYLNLFDSVAGISFTADLAAPITVVNSAYTPTDPHFNDFTVANTSAAGTTYVWDLTSFSAWNTYKASASAANSVFDVNAGNRTSSAYTAGNFGFMTTSNTAITTINNVTNSGLLSMGTKSQDNFLGGLNGILGVNTMPGLAAANGGSTTALATDGLAYVGTQKGASLFNSAITSMDSVANSQSFYQLTDVTGTALSKANVVKYAGSWSLNYAANTLTYSVAAVPEADTWAMMLAGLMIVGGITRRRMSA